jgi:hypothetical protein
MFYLTIPCFFVDMGLLIDGAGDRLTNEGVLNSVIVLTVLRQISAPNTANRPPEKVKNYWFLGL